MNVFKFGGASVKDVKEHGLWKSDCMYKYAPKQMFTTTVSSALAKGFGH